MPDLNEFNIRTTYATSDFKREGSITDCRTQWDAFTCHISGSGVLIISELCFQLRSQLEPAFSWQSFQILTRCIQGPFIFKIVLLCNSVAIPLFEFNAGPYTPYSCWNLMFNSNFTCVSQSEVSFDQSWSKANACDRTVRLSRPQHGSSHLTRG